MTSNKKEIWVNAISTQTIRRAWELRRALRSRTIASAIVIAGDYETKVLIESNQRTRLQNILNSHQHKMVVNNVKRPSFTVADCGWEVADGYLLFHLNNCEKCREFNNFGRADHDTPNVPLDLPAQNTTVTPGQLTVDFTLDKDQTTDHYMRLDMSELNRLQKKYATWIAVIENVKTVRTLEQEKVAQEQANRRASGMEKMEDLQKQIDILKKEMGL